jgi:maleate isomerase
LTSGSHTRIGLLIPSSNSVMEVDFYRNVPSDVTVHTARMFMEETTPEGEGRMIDEFAFPAARALATARPDIIVFGCTSAGALRGNAYDADLCSRLSAETGTAVVSVISSVRDAIRRRGAQRIGIITPYVAALNDKIRASVEEDGVEVESIHGLDITENLLIAEVGPEEIVAFAERSFASKAIDLIFASCTNFRALDAIEAIQDRLGVPVVTSNVAALEATLRVLARAQTGSEGFGGAAA